MLNKPWCASMLVSILLSSIRPQQNWTASIATLWIANNKDKSRHTKISERWHCASTRTGIASNNGTLNSYSKNKHMLNMLRICLVINICEQILQSRIKSIHASPKELCADFLNPFFKTFFKQNIWHAEQWIYTYWHHLMLKLGRTIHCLVESTHAKGCDP